MDEKQMFPLGEERSGVFPLAKFLEERGGLVNQLHLLQTGTAWWEYTHTHLHIHVCPHTHMHVKTPACTRADCRKHTHTDPEVCGNMPM